MESVLTKKQSKSYRIDFNQSDGAPTVLLITLRYDDGCGNGHNSFFITGDLYDRKDRTPGEPSLIHEPSNTRLWLGSCGCLHDDIRKYAPDFAGLVKWHGCSSDGPMHYIANTVYHAAQHGPTRGWIYAKSAFDPLKLDRTDRLISYEDANGLREAEKHSDAYRVVWDEKTAKIANYDYARLSAIWPEATDAELSVPADVLKEKLIERLPKLMEDFQAAMTGFGFVY